MSRMRLRGTARPTALSMPAIAPGPDPRRRPHLQRQQPSELPFLLSREVAVLLGACGRPACRQRAVSGAKNSRALSTSHQTTMRQPHHRHSRSLRPRMHVGLRSGRTCSLRAARQDTLFRAAARIASADAHLDSALASCRCLSTLFLDASSC
jgi:hypothetical protein